jgi:hypothetical protein
MSSVSNSSVLTPPQPPPYLWQDQYYYATLQKLSAEHWKIATTYSVTQRRCEQLVRM